jgi:hypothetical protein
MLRTKLDILQRQMLLRLEDIRASYHHSGNKGANAEQALREFLRSYLPPYNRVGHGEAIDQSGNNSRQLDVIITNEHHPYLNDLAEPSVFFVEGIACVAEVKSVLTGVELERSLENSLSFKQLEVKVPQGATCCSNPEDLSRFINKRPSFLFAYESQLSIPTIIDRINSWNDEHALPVPHQLDAVFILSGGSVVNFGAGTGTLKYITPSGDSVAGYIAITNEHDQPLVSLLSWISASLPRLSLPHPPILQYLVRSVEEIRQSQETAGEAQNGNHPSDGEGGCGGL